MGQNTAIARYLDSARIRNFTTQTIRRKQREIASSLAAVPPVATALYLIEQPCSDRASWSNATATKPSIYSALRSISATPRTGYTGRYTQADPLGKLGDPNAYAYALGNPITNADPLGLKVFRCCRDLQVNAVVNGVAQVFGYKHCFIKTDSVEAGLGPANGGPLELTRFRGHPNIWEIYDARKNT